MNSYDSYRLKHPSERQEALDRIREMLLSQGAELNETLQYGMPTYSQDGEVLFAFASQKHHLAFYVCHYDLLEAFKDELSKYDCGKSCIRFKKLNEDLLILLESIVNHTLKTSQQSQFYGKYLEKKDKT